jgi:hypothetical protein
MRPGRGGERWLRLYAGMTELCQNNIEQVSRSGSMCWRQREPRFFASDGLRTTKMNCAAPTAANKC